VYDISGPSEQHQQESDQQLPYYLRRPKQFSAAPQGKTVLDYNERITAIVFE